MANIIFPEGAAERRRLRRENEIDPMTGLANRKAFDLAKRTAEEDPFTVFVVFDLNNLGLANKVDGHEIGDRIIKTAADTLRIYGGRQLKTNRVFRIGGDEFVMLVNLDAMELDYWKLDDGITAIRQKFGTWKLSNGVPVSISGYYGATFAEADADLQRVKKRDKDKDARSILHGVALK